MFTKLLVPLDRSPFAQQAIAYAAALAERCNAPLDLVLVHEPFPNAISDAEVLHGSTLEIDQAYIEQIAGDLTTETTVPVTFAVMRGLAPEMICERAKQVGADLIVMTTHGRTGLSRAWLGSVADAIVRRSSIPVLMLRPTESRGDEKRRLPPFKHVLVPLDGSAVAADILPAAADFARANGADITLLRVTPNVPMVLPLDPVTPLGVGPVIPDAVATAELAAEMKKQLADVARQVRERTGLVVESHVCVSDRTADAIHEFAAAHDIDVIAMSTQGRGASRLLLGSVADKVLRSSARPVLLRRSTRTGRASELISERAVVEQLPALSSP